jgi:membrane protease YdiL (CAAX protease family)
LFFRGLLQPLLVRDLGVIVGVLVSAVPFALLHGPEFAWSWRHILLIAIAGTGFAVKRLTSGSVGAAMLTHSAYNAVITTGHLLGRNLIDG